QRRRLSVIILLGLVALSALFLRSYYVWRVGVGLLCGAIAVCVALKDAGDAAFHARANIQEVTYAATMVPSGETISIEVANLRESRAMLVWWGLTVLLAGAALLVASLRQAGDEK